MNDMSSVIIAKSDQLNADSFIAGPATFTIREVQIRGGQEQPVNIMLDETDLAYRPCKSMSRVLVEAWGPDANQYRGRSLTLYRDPTVKWGGMEVGGIRISHMSHIDGKMQMALTATKGQRKPHVVMPLVIEKPASARQSPEDWARRHLAEIDRVETADALNALIERRREAVEKLARDRPKIADSITDAYATRAGSLAGEGPADEQRGEAHDMAGGL